MIYIANKRSKLENLKKKYPDAEILDITSATDNAELQLLSPFYPHGGIPIPFTEGRTAMSVEGIWQGLKVFEGAGIDRACFYNTTMKGLKRTVRRFGAPRGHQKGLNSTELLGYLDAREQIYLPSYLWVLENVDAVRKLVERIAEKSKQRDIVFLDYNTNADYLNPKSPLSHAALVKLYIEGRYPGMLRHDI